MQLKNARILLTGASGGLGHELASQLSTAGAALLLAGRDERRLNEVRAALPEEAAVVVADLTSTDGIARTARAAEQFRANVLINNAGACAFGLLENQPWATVEQVLATSLEAPIHLTHALLPWLRAQPQAAIVNIGSVVGFAPEFGMSIYGATKAFVLFLSQGMSLELSPKGVYVQAVLPAATRSDI